MDTLSDADKQRLMLQAAEKASVSRDLLIGDSHATPQLLRA